MEPLPPFPFVNVNLEILYTAKGNFYYFLYTHKFKLQGFKRELTKLAVDFSLGGSVKKFPLINSKRPDFLPGTCLILQGPFNNVFVALKYYFKKWGGLNTHISYLQGLTELNQEEIRFTVLKTEIKPSSENSSGVKQNGQNIPRSDPLPHLDIDKEFTKNFLKACKTDRPTPISETEEKIKSYIVNLTHKYTFLSFKLILNRVPLKVLDDLISAAKSFTTTESTKFNRITTNTNTSFSFKEKMLEIELAKERAAHERNRQALTQERAARETLERELANSDQEYKQLINGLENQIHLLEKQVQSLSLKKN